MERFSAAINAVFGPLLRPLFNPLDALFTPIPRPLWQMSAVGLFVAAMVWVFLLKKDYVNVDAPRRDIWHDLRFWTVLTMLPHVIVYLWF